jgi:hypothetical protein
MIGDVAAERAQIQLERGYSMGKLKPKPPHDTTVPAVVTGYPVGLNRMAGARSDHWAIPRIRGTPARPQNHPGIPDPAIPALVDEQRPIPPISSV